MGNDSAFISGRYETIPANIFMSKISGKRTPLIKYLEALFHMDLEEQRAELRTFSRVYKEKKRKLKDLSVTEVGLWLRNRYMDEWRKNPTLESSKKVIAELRYVLDYRKNTYAQRDLDKIFIAAQNYIPIKLQGNAERRIQLQYANHR